MSRCSSLGEGSQRFRNLRLIESILHQLGVAEDGSERRSQLMAHVGYELRLVLARDLQVLDRLGEFTCARLHLLEQPRILDGNDRLVREGADELDLAFGEWAHFGASD